MLDEVVILAGGFGTRLSHVLGNVPKPMAPVYGKPFLTYLLDRLHEQHFRRVVLATGYMHEVVERYFGNRYHDMEIVYSVEDHPLFTGGAIRKASEQITGDNFLVLNGDTLFDVDLTALYALHTESKSPVTLALRHVEDAGRYGAVETDGTTIIHFREKDPNTRQGLINGGIYVIRREWLQQQDLPEAFSFEHDILQRDEQHSFRGLRSEGYFIDIGVPDDYYRAQREFKDLFAPDAFLFLDRDGVLNRQIVGDYVRCWEQWKWLDDVLPTLQRLRKQFRRIFIVSNQQGVGKGLFTQQDLDNIHKRMLDDIAQAGGKIDGVYVCTALKEEQSPSRKPAIGLALQAQKEFAEVDFTRSVMIGDSVSDMQFGYNAKMRCIYLTKNNPVPEEVRDYTDLFMLDLGHYFS